MLQIVSRAEAANPSPLTCRWLYQEPADGAWNMAVDEVLLESAAADGIATMRCYGWSVPTLSLGYFQRAVERNLHPASAACPLVRRASGGGAILHDAELTYSLALPIASRPTAGAADLYFAVHESLIGALATMGIEAHLCRNETVGPIGPQPFLCFERRGDGDLLVVGHKIAGSAQRRHRGAVLQHGSILLAASPRAPELPGIAEVTGRLVKPEQLANVFRTCLEQRLNLTWDVSDDDAAKSAAFDQQCQRLAREKYGVPAWTNRR